jgi:polysaccharide export outer membrane protein
VDLNQHLELVSLPCSQIRAKYGHEFADYMDGIKWINFNGYSDQPLTMPPILSNIRFFRSALLACGAAMLLAGCQRFQTVNPNTSILDAPVPPAQEPPRELNKVSLPAYRIEPPDILQIEMLKLVPLPPYRAEVFDVLQVRVANTLVDQPVDGYFMVEAEGVINLGPAYGNVRVAGMTIEQITEAVSQHLRRVLNQPVVSVQLARVAGAQPVTGQYLVGPDGTINLRQYGVVHVSGKTVTEARVAIQKHLQQFLDSPELSVDVLAYNSKNYYVITQGAGLGDKVARFPITGNETVLDALAQQTIGGTSPVSSKKIWIARPSPSQSGCEQILPVDWYAITQGAQTSTNYQILPGDRVYIAEDKVTALTNTIARITGPLERVMGIAGLSFSTTRAGQTMGRNYNKQRSG